MGNGDSNDDEEVEEQTTRQPNSWGTSVLVLSWKVETEVGGDPWSTTAHVVGVPLGLGLSLFLVGFARCRHTGGHSPALVQ